MAKEEANTKRDDKRRREEDVTGASFLDLIKRGLEIQDIDAETKLLACQGNRVMFAVLSLIDPVNHVCFARKQASIRQYRTYLS
jgi:hypothetical protein